MALTHLIRHARRRLLRAPAFTASATLTLAAGIGGTVAAFALVNGVLLRPLPYRDAERLVHLEHTLAIAGVSRVDQSDATYLLYRRDNRVFSDLGIYRATSVNLAPTAGQGGDAAPERVAAAVLTPSVFRVLAVAPVRGRGLTEDDAALGAAPVVVIGQGLWRRTFGSDPAIIGRRVSVDGIEREIVGVMPQSLRFPAPQTALWTPTQLDPAHTNSAAFEYQGIARLRDGVTVDAARADLNRLLPEVPEAFPGRLTADAIRVTHMQAVVRPLKEVLVGDVARTLWIVLGAVATLLLVACANVANLFLARGEGRRRELAVRRALGAGGGVLLAEFLMEAVILAAVGGALGLLAVAPAVRLLQVLGVGQSLPRLADVRVDAWVALFALGATTFAALVVSALPVLRTRRGDLASGLMEEGRSATAPAVRHRARRTLVVSQVALALVLLAAAGLLVRSFQRLRAVDPGFEASHALSFRLAFPSTAYPAATDAARAITQTLGALSALPGVAAAGMITKLPLDEEARQDSAVFLEDRPLTPGQIPGIHSIAFATPGYFAAMGIPVIEGQLFAAPDPSADLAKTPRQVVVSRAFAERYWKGQSAVGKRVRMDPRVDWSVIVGVVGDVRDAGLDRPPAELVYAPLLTTGLGGVERAPAGGAFVLRTAGDPVDLAATAREAVRRVAPGIPLYRVMPLSDLLSQSMARTTFTLVLLGLAALVATAIGAVGIYGVLAYLVSLRAREMGLRLALGAQPRDVRRLVMGHALADAGLGIAAGLAAALLLTRLLTAMLFGVGAADVGVLVGASVVLLVTALAASWLPARRAARLDPAIALRME